MTTAAEEMRAIAQEEVGRFAEILADEFLSAPTRDGVVNAPAFWQLLHRAIRRYDEKVVEVPV